MLKTFLRVVGTTILGAIFFAFAVGIFMGGVWLITEVVAPNIRFIVELAGFFFLGMISYVMGWAILRDIRHWRSQKPDVGVPVPSADGAEDRDLHKVLENG